MLINPSFQGVNRLFVLSFENEEDRKASTGYYLPKVEIKDCNIMTDGKNFIDQPVKSDIRVYDNISKIATGQRDYCTTGCLLDYNYFKKHYKMIVIDLSKFDANPKTTNATLFFIIEEAKETILDFSHGTVKVL